MSRHAAPSSGTRDGVQPIYGRRRCLLADRNESAYAQGQTALDRASTVGSIRSSTLAQG